MKSVAISAGGAVVAGRVPPMAENSTKAKPKNNKLICLKRIFFNTNQAFEFQIYFRIPF